MGPWSVRGLLVGLMDREPPVFQPRWAPGMPEELSRRIARDASGPRGARAAGRHADGVVRALTEAFPEAEVPVSGGPFRAARAARADAVASADATTTGDDVAVLTADELLLELHADEPWRVLHATVLFAFRLRRQERTIDDLLAALEEHVPRFVAAVRGQMAALPAGQPPSVLAAAGLHPDVADEAEEGWWSIACDPFPCPGHDALAFDLWGTRAACVTGGECCFVGVTQTARHRTLVWPAPDDPRMLEIAAETRDQHRNPRPVPYSRDLGPAVSYWEWEATGNLVHGVHESSTRPDAGAGRPVGR